jgi:hypothetical protein
MGALKVKLLLRVLVGTEQNYRKIYIFFLITFKCLLRLLFIHERLKYMYILFCNKKIRYESKQSSFLGPWNHNNLSDYSAQLVDRNDEWGNYSWPFKTWRDILYYIFHCVIQYGGLVSSMDKAPGCWCRGPGFESRPGPSPSSAIKILGTAWNRRTGVQQQHATCVLSQHAFSVTSGPWQKVSSGNWRRKKTYRKKSNTILNPLISIKIHIQEEVFPFTT